MTLQSFDKKCSSCVPSYCKTISNVHLTFWSFIFCTLSHLRLLIHGSVLCKLSFI